MTGWYSTGNHNGGLCYDSGYHLEPPQKGRGGHRVAWQKHNVVKVFLQPQKAPPFDHNDKHGVKLSQQRRSHYVANYQEFRRNVSLRCSKNSGLDKWHNQNLLQSHKVKSKILSRGYWCRCQAIYKWNRQHHCPKKHNSGWLARQVKNLSPCRVKQ